MYVVLLVTLDHRLIFHISALVPHQNSQFLQVRPAQTQTPSNTLHTHTQCQTWIRYCLNIPVSTVREMTTVSRLFQYKCIYIMYCSVKKDDVFYVVLGDKSKHNFTHVKLCYRTTKPQTWLCLCTSVIKLIMLWRNVGSEWMKQHNYNWRMRLKEMDRGQIAGLTNFWPEFVFIVRFR